MFTTTKTYYEATVTKAQPDIGLDRLMRGTRAWPITKGRTIQNIGLEKPINWKENS